MAKKRKKGEKKPLVSKKKLREFEFTFLEILVPVVIIAALGMIFIMPLQPKQPGFTDYASPSQPEPQEGQGPSGFVPLPDQPYRPVSEVGIGDISRDGGGYYVVIISSFGPIGIRSVALDGEGAAYEVAGNGSHGEGGSATLIHIPDIVDCSDQSEAQNWLEINYTSGEDNGTLSGQVSFIGCTAPPDEVETLPPQCRGAGEPCTGGDCCEGMECNLDAGICAIIPTGCAPLGQACGSVGCCAGLRCDEGTNSCLPMPSCQTVKQNCTSASDCCAYDPPLVCRDLRCYFCSSRGEACTSDSDCCQRHPALVCAEGVCGIGACSSAGGPCEEDSDCCSSGLECTFDVCKLR